MANNIFQVKRTSTTGRTPNTTVSTNTQYINPGELALNMTDGILYSSTGSLLITVGANVVNKNITGTLTANGSNGSSGQVLTSNGAGIYWSTVSSSGGGSGLTIQSYTADGVTNTFTVTGGYTPNSLSVFVNGSRLRNGTEANVQNGSTFTILTGNPPSGAFIDVLGSSSLFTNGAFLSIGNSVITNTNITVGNSTVNTNLTQTTMQVANSTANVFSVNTTIYYIGTNVVLGNTTLAVGLQANGSYGTAGQVLASNGTATYWTTPTTYATTGKAIAMAIVFGG